MISLNDVLLAMSNIPVDDPIAEIWGRGLQGGDKIIEYTGTFPITINANGDALLDYRIYGADGGVGEPTENLFDNRNLGWYNNNTGQFIDDSSTANWRIPVQKGDIIYANNRNEMGWGCGFYQGTFVPGSRVKPSMFPYTVPDGIDELTNNYPAGSSAMVTKNQPLPDTYIPYGYKLPMTVCDGDTTQTVPVYIGENQLDSVEGVADYVDKASGKIVRMIGEYTFTGDELWYAYSVGFYTSYKFLDANVLRPQVTTRFSHFSARINASLGSMYSPTFGDDCGCLRLDEGNVMVRSTSNFTTVAECKAYLKAQYDNGTPVKISYWLKTPVEEDPPVPFPDIPTINGETVIDYDGDPKPSQMYVKYKGKSDGE